MVSHRKRIFIIQALPCPFHSEGSQPTALDGGSQPFALAGPISTFGLDWGYQCPTPNRYPCFFPRKPSAFHSHVSTCQPTIGASLQPTALNRPRTPRANFTLTHKSVLVKFSFSRTQRRALNRAARASSHAVRFTSERRKWSLPCSVRSLLVPRRRVHLAPQRVCLFSFPSPAASASLEGFQPKRGDGHSHRPRCRPYPTAQPSAIWSAMFTAHSPTPCPNAKPSHYATVSALVGVPMFRSPQPTSTSPPSHPTAQASPLDAPHALAILPSPAPNHPPVDEVGALRA